MTDTIHTVTLTPQEQAAFESGRKIGWNEGIEAAAKEASRILIIDAGANAKTNRQWAIDLFEYAEDIPEYIRAPSMPAAPIPASEDEGV